MSKKDDPPPEYVPLKDCMTRHLSIENRLTTLEKLRITEIATMIVGFAIVLLKLFGKI